MTKRTVLPKLNCIAPWFCDESPTRCLYVAFVGLSLFLSGCATSTKTESSSERLTTFVGNSAQSPKFDGGFNMSQRMVQTVTVGKASDSVQSDGFISQIAVSTVAIAGAAAVNGNSGSDVVAGGLLASVLAAGIHSNMARDAIQCLQITRGWGPRMECTTVVAAHVMPVSSIALYASEDFSSYGSSPHKLAIVKNGKIHLNMILLEPGNRLALYRLVGGYQGDEYASRFPNTEGFEFKLTEVVKGKGSYSVKPGFFGGGPDVTSFKAALFTADESTNQVSPLESIR